MRSRILLNTLSAPPPVGSLRESVLAHLIFQMEQAEHYRFTIMAELELDKEKAVNMFSDYFKLAFPFVESSEKQKSDQMAAIMKREIASGPLAMTPLKAKKMRSRMRRPDPSVKRTNALMRSIGSDMVLQ